MISLQIGGASLILSVVLTAALVEESIPPGTTQADVEKYFSEIGAPYHWIPRDSGDDTLRTFPIQDHEIGVLSSGLIRNVRSAWWQPSFGRVLIVNVGISSEGLVTQHQIIRMMDGWL